MSDSIHNSINLDQYQNFPGIDRENMLGHIDGLPDQLQDAWKLGQGQLMPCWEGIQQVLITGMGGSAIGAELLAAYVAPICSVPVFVHRDYDLPLWAQGAKTLVIASSHSGNTEETLSGFKQASQAGCCRLCITTGGELAAQAESSGAGLWVFNHTGQPRSAVGFSFGLLLAALYRLGLVTDQSPEIRKTVEAMRAQQESLKADVPVVKNPAKRLAGQLMGRWVGVFGSGILAPVARRWKGQVSEIAKAWAQFEFLPEADHNTLAGTKFPEELLSHTMMLFLRSRSDHSRNLLRTEATRKTFMLEGMNTDIIDAQGETRMARQWTCLHLGDYMAYYLAMLYGVDPTPVEALQTLKQELKAAQT